MVRGYLDLCPQPKLRQFEDLSRQVDHGSRIEVNQCVQGWGEDDHIDLFVRATFRQSPDQVHFQQACGRLGSEPGREIIRFNLTPAIALLKLGYQSAITLDPRPIATVERFDFSQIASRPVWNRPS